MKLLHDIEQLSEYWWMVLLRGVVALLFAASIWVATGVLDLRYGTSIGLVFIQACFGGYLLVAGLFSIGMAVLVLKQRHWTVTAIHSVLLLALALWLLYSEADTIAPLAVLVALHAALSGAGEISLARHMRRHQLQSAALFGAGLFSLAAAVVLVTQLHQLERLVLITAVYAGVFGVVLIATSFQLRVIRRQALASAAEVQAET
jgi:uncharacterized membrane protein HdeD (DUF308 family)